MHCDLSPGEAEIKGFLGLAGQQSNLIGKSKAPQRDTVSKDKIDGS